MNEKPLSKPDENPSDERNSEPAKPMKVDLPPPPATKENNPSDEDNAEPPESLSKSRLNGLYGRFGHSTDAVLKYPDNQSSYPYKLSKPEQQSQSHDPFDPDPDPDGPPQPNSGPSTDFDEDDETEDNNGPPSDNELSQEAGMHAGFWLLGQAMAKLKTSNVPINSEDADILITVATDLIDIASKQDPKAFERVTAALIAKED